MLSKRQQERARRARERICQIQKQIATFDIACRGSLLCRKKRCGNPKCRCTVSVWKRTPYRRGAASGRRAA